MAWKFEHVAGPFEGSTGSLVWDGKTGWLDDKDSCKVLAFTSYGDGEALVANRAMVEALQKDKHLALVWFVFEEKQVIFGTFGDDHAGLLALKTNHKSPKVN